MNQERKYEQPETALAFSPQLRKDSFCQIRSLPEVDQEVAKAHEGCDQGHLRGVGRERPLAILLQVSDDGCVMRRRTATSGCRRGFECVLGAHCGEQ